MIAVFIEHNIPGAWVKCKFMVVGLSRRLCVTFSRSGVFRNPNEQNDLNTEDTENTELTKKHGRHRHRARLGRSAIGNNTCEP